MIKTSNFSDRDLAQFRDCQRRSFAILESVASSLQGGETEKQVARRLVALYREAGVKTFFHLPVVLFGDRAGLPGSWRIANFFPRERELREGDSVILDAAPLFGGYLVDTSFSFCLGENSRHREMMQHLSQYRESVPAAVNRGESFRSIAHAVHQTMKAEGFEPVHTKHPGNVLGHRAIKTWSLPYKPRLQGFDALSLGWFRLQDGLVQKGVGKKSPLWNESPASDHTAHDGLWLVEPHASRDGVGAKWEEMLLIKDGVASWLDDDTPHCRQWQNIGSGASYAPAMNAAH